MILKKKRKKKGRYDCQETCLIEVKKMSQIRGELHDKNTFAFLCFNKLSVMS